MNEIFVAVRDIDYIDAKIDSLCKKYNSRRGTDYIQQRSLFRSYCHDTLSFFDDCFATQMLGMIRCKAKVKEYQYLDNLEIDNATLDIVNMLWDLKQIVGTMVPIKDLPSCKKLTELSPEDIISMGKDLVKSDIVKVGAGILQIGSKVSDIIRIEDVEIFYKDRLSELTEEIKTKGGKISDIEQFLMDKFNAELGYCNIALFKAGIGITKDLSGLVEIGRKHIEKYENELKKNGEKFQARYVE